VRSGGTYVADPKTGEETLVERTEQPDPVTDEAGEADPGADPAAPSRRKKTTVEE
jgi:hypothetical protein